MLRQGFLAAATIGLVSVPVAAQTDIRMNDFVRAIRSADTFQMEAAKIMQRSDDADARAFATKQLQSSVRNLYVVANIARSAGMKIGPATLSSADTSTLAALREARGGDQIATYYAVELAHCRTDMELARNYAELGTVSPLQDIAQRNAMTARRRLASLRTLAGSHHAETEVAAVNGTR